MNYRPIVPAAMSLVARHERVWHRGDGFGYSDRSVKPRTAQHLFFAALIGAGVLQWSVSEAQESAAVAELQAAVQAETRINQDSAESQRLVSGLAQQTADLLEEYRSVVRETEALKIYNDNLERLVTDQREEVTSINRQLSGLEETNRNVVPLMLEMIETLGRIVEADIPFRIDERRARVDRLRRMMGQAEVTVSEKYREVMEAYQGELEFGRSTEAYSGRLQGSGQTVDFLRVGRTLLLYQSSDGKRTGWFNPASRSFEALPERYRREVREGLAMARNEQAPRLLLLPVPGPEGAQ